MSKNTLECKVCGKGLVRAIMKHREEDNGFDIYCSSQCEEIEKEYDSGVLKVDLESIEGLLSIHQGTILGLQSERLKAVELHNAIKADISRLDSNILSERNNITRLEKLSKLIQKRKENALNA